MMAAPILLSPERLALSAYTGFWHWLEGNFWQEEMPFAGDLLSGKEAAHVLARGLSPRQRLAFIDGWEMARKEKAQAHGMGVGRAIPGNVPQEGKEEASTC